MCKIVFKISILLVSSLIVQPIIAAEFNKEDRLQDLTPIQYQVTQQSATERPFQNAYWNNDGEGIYVDVVSGEVLFSSRDKYKSGTGWPSFSQVLSQDNIVLKEDRRFLFLVRTEVRSKHANSHLGHVFTDGPKPIGLRYCINSAALIFIPKSEMVARGYGEYLKDL